MIFWEQQKERAICLFYYIIAMIIRPFVRVRSNRLFFWCYNFDKYSCNPRALTEYILEKHSNEFEIYWAFDSSFDASKIDKKINVVRLRSLKYFVKLYSSKFVFSNLRNARFDTGFVKKSTQKYIMLWHGSFPLKKIEKDAESQLGTVYVRRAVDDSRMCDLMLADSFWFKSLIKKSFWYDGEILMSGIPRNDIFYNIEKINNIYSDTRIRYNLPCDQKIVLYAPTFRDNHALHYYKLNWPLIIASFEKMLGGEVTVFMRLHPNMSKIKGIESIIIDSRVINVTSAPDITDFLLAADAMVSDYTSAMFDFCRLKRPCFMYAIDTDSYNRGFYWKWEDLPFSLSKNEKQLLENIVLFSKENYAKCVDDFIKNNWGLFENGTASKQLVEWLKLQ